jgi:hypothetical protein
MRRFLAPILGLGAFVAAGTAAGEVLERYSTGMWTIEASSDRGAFDGCTALGKYGSASVLFLLTRDYAWGIAITNPRWNWRKGSEGRVSYWIDSYGRRSGKAEARSATQLLIPLADSQQLFQEIRGGNKMYFEPEGADPFSITLVGTSVGLNELMSCVRRHR